MSCPLVADGVSVRLSQEGFFLCCWRVDDTSRYKEAVRLVADCSSVTSVFQCRKLCLRLCLRLFIYLVLCPLPCRTSKSPVRLTAEGRLLKLQGMTSGLPPSSACTGSSPCVLGMLVEMLLPGEWRELLFHVVSKLLFLMKKKKNTWKSAMKG